MGHMPALDGLRGVAVAVVVWHNVVGVSGAVAHTTPAKPYFIAAAAGWVGVTLFFALSGFLITGILLDMKGLPHAWRTFSIRRALRIFPLYYAALALVFLVLPLAGLLPTWLVADRANQVWYWSYLVNWTEPFGRGGPGLAHFWTLAVEEQFYLLWPLVVLRIRAPSLVVLCLTLTVTALATRALILASPLAPLTASHAVYTFTICRWDALALGALVAVAARDHRWGETLARLARPAAITAAILVFALGLMRHGFGTRDTAMETAGQSLFAILSASVVALGIGPSVRGSAGIRHALSHPVMRTFGKYSYAIYVFHFPLCHVARGLLPVAAMEGGGLAAAGVLSLATLLVFGLSFILALVSWRLLEKPALDLRGFLAAPSR
jgi:peptidoglycan/LPS O-acetylase OafA/YrhL